MASLASLLVQETKAQIYARGLAVAQAFGLPVTSWAPGDPTRTLYGFLAKILSDLEVNVAGYLSSGFLDYASGDWLTILAKEGVYNIDRVPATFAGTSVVLTNNGGGLYVIEPGDLVVKSPTNGRTYTNTSGGTLASGPTTTLPLDFVADEAGSASSAGPTEINTLVTSLLGVTCSNPTAAVGLDAEQDQPLRDRCRAKLATLSPNGPSDAYNFVVRTPSLTGSSEITRSRTSRDSTTGSVTVYVAGASGAVSGSAITAAQTAVERYATPLCITPTVVNCTSVSIAVTYEIWLYEAVGEDDASIKATIETALAAMLAARPIGGDVIPPATTGALYHSLIARTISAAYPTTTFRVQVTSPAADTALAINAVPVLSGAPTATIHREANP